MTLPSGSGERLPDTPEARRYNRIRRYLTIADFALGLGLLLLLILARTRGGFRWTEALRDYSYVAAGHRYSLAVFFFVVAVVFAGRALSFGLDYYGFRLEHRYHLSNQKLASWLWDQVKEFMIGVVLAGIIVEVIYGTIRLSSSNWWLIAWGVFIVLTISFAQIAPVVLFPLFYKFEPLKNDELRDRLVRLGERAGAKVHGVYEWKLSEKSKKANAALTGLGRTRRILLADTLLDQYSADEIEAVLAHELGHHVHGHITKGIAVQVVVTFFGFWATAALLDYAVYQRHMFLSIADFASLPLLALVSTVMSFLLMPVLNAYSRFNERQADRYCFRAVPDVGPFITSMNKLSEQNLAERNPSRFVEWFFHSHPATSRRIADAEAFRRQRRVGAHVKGRI